MALRCVYRDLFGSVQRREEVWRETATDCVNVGTLRVEFYDTICGAGMGNASQYEGVCIGPRPNTAAINVRSVRQILGFYTCGSAFSDVWLVGVPGHVKAQTVHHRSHLSVVHRTRVHKRAA